MKFYYDKKFLVLAIGLLAIPSAMILSSPDDFQKTGSVVTTAPDKNNRFYWKQIGFGLGTIAVLTTTAVVVTGVWAICNIDSIEYHGKLSKQEFKIVHEAYKRAPSSVFKTGYPNYNPRIAVVQNFFYKMKG